MKSKVLIVGGTGLVGQRIIELLPKDKYEIALLSRNPKSESKIPTYKWNINDGYIDEKAFDGVEHIINLAGAGIADKSWTEARKKIILESRTNNNQLIAQYLSNHNIKLKSYLAASAIGYYGNRSDELLDENSKRGTSEFLSDITMEWEKAIAENKPYADRLAIFRIGIVLSTKGGALQKMLMGSKFGSAVYFGKGDQYYSWIHIDDLADIFIKSLDNESYHGIINAVTDNTTCKNVAQAIKDSSTFNVIHSAPAFAIKAMMGEMASVVLNSTRVVPKRLKELGFNFKHKEIGQAILDLKKRKV